MAVPSGLAQRNLFKYFVKNLGCRLVDAGELVPPDLVELLPRESFTTKLKITFLCERGYSFVTGVAVRLPWQGGT